MAEPKYYDELPTYIMHSDGEFKEGVFKAVDGSGNSLTIGTEKGDTEGKLTIEGTDKAEFQTVFEKNGDETETITGGTFTATIAGIAFQIVASVMSVGAQAIEALTVVFNKGEDTISISLPSQTTLIALFDALMARVTQLLPKNIKDGTGTGGVISGAVSGQNACVASGENSFAGGSGSKASGLNSFAFGDGEATSEGAVSFHGGSAKGEKSFAIGYGMAYGEESFAGADGYAEEGAYASFSFGVGCVSQAEGSVSFGARTVAKGYLQTVIGSNNIIEGTKDEIVSTENAFIIGNGTDNQHRSNALAVRWDGAIVLANGTVLTVEQLAKVANLT